VTPPPGNAGRPRRRSRKGKASQRGVAGGDVKAAPRREAPRPGRPATADVIGKLQGHPDGYLLAARLLGVAPARCLAVEDTATGIAAAKAAGMFAVQVRAASTALPPLAEADLVIDDFSQLDLSLLDRVRA